MNRIETTSLLLLKKAPPHNQEAERSVIGGILVDNEYLKTALDIIHPDDFYSDKNRKIFEAMMVMRSKELPIDLVLLNEELHRIGQLEEAGGSAYLSSLMDGVPRSINVKYYARLVREKSLLRQLIYSAAKIVTSTYEPADNTQALIEQAQAEIVSVADKVRLIGAQRENSEFAAAYKEYIAWKDGESTFVSTGYPSFDHVTDDYLYGEIISIFSRTTVGKTFCALNMINHLITSRSDMGLFSLEMAKGPIIERMLQIHFGLSKYEIHSRRTRGALPVDEFLRRFSMLKLYGLVYSVAEIARIIEQDKLRVVFIDFLQLLRADREGSPYEVTTRKMRDVKEMAKNKEVVVFLLVQLSRKAEGGWEPVSIDHARESGAIEELSDFIIALWDPSLNPAIKDDSLKGKICVRLLKNKRGPAIGIECTKDFYTGRIIEIAKETVQ